MASADAAVIDADGHLVEPVAQLSRFGWRRSSTGHPDVDLMFAHPEVLQARGLCPDARPFEATSRLEDMDREGIEVAVNYPTALLPINQLAPDVAAELSHAYNSWAYEAFTVPTGGRVLTMAVVSLADAGAAVSEARRAVVELGAPGVMASPFAGQRHLDDPALDPLWALVEELDVAVGIHGGRSTTPPLLAVDSFRDDRRYYAMAHPFGQMMAMGDLTIGGVCDRFPKVRFAFLEAGIGWVRWYADRLDEAAESVVEVRGEAAGPGTAPSERLFGGTCYFSCEPDEPDLPRLIESVGADHVLFASDYPHFDAKFPDSARTIAERGLDAATLEKVTSANARRLYRL